MTPLDRRRGSASARHITVSKPDITASPPQVGVSDAPGRAAGLAWIASTTSMSLRMSASRTGVS